MENCPWLLMNHKLVNGRKMWKGDRNTTRSPLPLWKDLGILHFWKCSDLTPRQKRTSDRKRILFHKSKDLLTTSIWVKHSIMECHYTWNWIYILDKYDTIMWTKTKHTCWNRARILSCISLLNSCYNSFIGFLLRETTSQTEITAETPRN